METVKGYVERVVYRNPENGYTVLELATGSENYTLVGILPHVSEGEPLEAEGTFVQHPQYGEQLSVERYRVTAPEDVMPEAALLSYTKSTQVRSWQLPVIRISIWQLTLRIFLRCKRMNMARCTTVFWGSIPRVPPTKWSPPLPPSTAAWSTSTPL